MRTIILGLVFASPIRAIWQAEKVALSFIPLEPVCIHTIHVTCATASPLVRMHGRLRRLSAEMSQPAII